MNKADVKALREVIDVIRYRGLEYRATGNLEGVVELEWAAQ